MNKPFQQQKNRIQIKVGVKAGIESQRDARQEALNQGANQGSRAWQLIGLPEERSRITLSQTEERKSRATLFVSGRQRRAAGQTRTRTARRFCISIITALLTRHVIVRIERLLSLTILFY